MGLNGLNLPEEVLNLIENEEDLMNVLGPQTKSSAEETNTQEKENHVVVVELNDAMEEIDVSNAPFMEETNNVEVQQHVLCTWACRG